MICAIFHPTLALVLSLAAPPETVAVGSRALNLAAFVPMTETLDNYSIRDSVQKPGGTMVITTAQIPTAVGEQWAIVSVWKNAAGAPPSVDSVIAAMHPLRVLRHRVLSATDSAAVTYDGTRVTGWVEPGHGKPRKRFDRSLSRPTFPDAFREKLIGALTLRLGFTAEIAAFDAWAGDEGTERLISVQVVGIDTLVVRGAQAKYFKILVDRHDPSGLATTLWIARTDRRLLKSESRSRDGKLLWWDVAR